MNSALYECTVLHERFAPKRHRFAYRIFYAALDLDELATLDHDLRLFSVGRSNFYRFDEGDHLPLGETVHRPTPGAPTIATAELGTLKQRVRALCTAHGADPGPDCRVQLVTLPRVLGHRFNPVSFFFCTEANGRPVGAIAEVTNTFREVKPYFIPAAVRAEGGARFRLRTTKHFYVSPFSGPALEFDFTLAAPGERLAVRIDDFEQGRRTLHTTLTGRRVPLTDARLAGFLAKYPLLTVGVVARIHWQALRLWLKRVPWFAKAAGAAEQRDLYRPHPSIARHHATS